MLSQKNVSTSAAAVIFFMYFNALIGSTIIRPKLSSIDSTLVVCDSGPESKSARFYRLQLRLPLRPKRSTRADSSSGLDSDSAALPFVVFATTVDRTFFFRIV